MRTFYGQDCESQFVIQEKSPQLKPLDKKAKRAELKSVNTATRNLKVDPETLNCKALRLGMKWQICKVPDPWLKFGTFLWFYYNFLSPVKIVLWLKYALLQDERDNKNKRR